MYHQEDTITIGTFFGSIITSLTAAPILFCFQKKGAADKAYYYASVIFLILYLTI